jgi:RHS repeat-associated protein
MAQPSFACGVRDGQRRVADASGSRAFRYGQLGEVVHATHHVDAIGAAPAVEGITTYAYDSFGHLQTLGYPDGTTLTYEYDAGANLSRVSAVRDLAAWNYVDRITYDVFGQRASIRYGNGIETRYGYQSSTRRLTEVDSTAAGGVPLQALRYNYNAVGNVIWRDNVVPTPAAGVLNGTSYQTFDYDLLDPLTTASGSHARGDTTRNYTLSMRYDSLGNITQKTQSDVIFTAPTWTGVPQSQTSYTWSYAYGGTRPHAPSTVGPRALTYDANGNQSGWNDSAAGQSRTLVWDQQDRVSSITTAGTEVTFRYDADGQRTHKHSSAGTTQYLNNLTTVRNGVAVTRHVFVGEQRIASSVLPTGMSDTSQLHFYDHSDPLQSAQFVTDGAGTVTEHYESMPFGEPWIDESVGTERMPYRFSAKELDEETGLYDFGARYFDPRQSQWVSPDPILTTYLTTNAAGGVRVPANLSLYAYSWNSPLRLRDPSGRVPLDAIADGIGLGLDIIDFVRDPSWSNAGAVAVSVGAMALPYVPSPRGLRILAHIVGDAAPAARHADDLARVGNRAADTSTATRRAENAAEATRAADRAPASSAVRETPAPQSGRGGCFAGETLVRTRQGLKRIDEVRVGDEVWAQHETSGVWGWFPVEGVTEREYVGPVVHFRAGYEEVLATADHPVCVDAGAALDRRALGARLAVGIDHCGRRGVWVAAGDLRAGDTLSAPECLRVSVSTLMNTAMSVYNL